MKTFRTKRSRRLPRASAVLALLTLGLPHSVGSADVEMISGGWEIDSDRFEIRYRPVRHADPFMTAWITIAAEYRQSHPPMGNIFRSLTLQTSQGVCSKCHAVDQREGIGTRVQWHAKTGPASQAFTRFDHAPHLVALSQPEAAEGGTMLERFNCSSCHRLASRDDDAYLKSFHDEFGAVRLDPPAALGEFSPISLSRCADCHVPDKAGDHCLMCHNYHHRPMTPARSGTPEPQ